MKYDELQKVAFISLMKLSQQSKRIPFLFNNFLVDLLWVTLLAFLQLMWVLILFTLRSVIYKALCIFKGKCSKMSM